MGTKEAWEMYLIDLKMKVRPELEGISARIDGLIHDDEAWVDLSAFDEFRFFEEEELEKMSKDELIGLVLKMSEDITDEISPLNETIRESIINRLEETDLLSIVPDIESEMLWCNSQLKRQILPQEASDISFML
jgi:hypothetical protein